MKPCKMCGFSVEQPWETVSFSEIQLKEIQSLNQIVRFLVATNISSKQTSEDFSPLLPEQKSTECSFDLGFLRTSRPF